MIYTFFSCFIGFIYIPLITIFHFFFLNAAAFAGEKEIVSKIFPYPIEFMKERIGKQFSSEERAFFEDYNSAIYLLPAEAKTINDLSEKEYYKFIAFPLARSSKFYVFYGAYPGAQHLLEAITPLSVASADNPALKRYAELALNQRSNDFYLWSPDAPYWYSEQSQSGHLLPFHSFFILHLTALGENSTEVEIIEDQPTVMTGKKRSVDANGRITRYEIVPSLPTVQDREFLLSCIRQFIERGVPGRHWFNCRVE